MDNILYSNSFRYAESAVEAQLLFRLSSPVFDDNNQNVIGEKLDDVVDIRLPLALTKDLYLSLKERFEGNNNEQ